MHLVLEQIVYLARLDLDVQYMCQKSRLLVSVNESRAVFFKFLLASRGATRVRFRVTTREINKSLDIKTYRVLYFSKVDIGERWRVGAGGSYTQEEQVEKLDTMTDN